MSKKPVVNNSNKPLQLSDFPPKLRKVGQYILDNGYNGGMKSIIDKLGLKYDSIMNMKCQLKLKHNKDFDLWLHSQRMLPLKKHSYAIYESIKDKAISGNIGQQRLVTELLGDIKDKVEIDHKITGLFAVVGSDPNIIPQDIIEADKVNKPDGKQIIDIDYED